MDDQNLVNPNQLQELTNATAMFFRQVADLFARRLGKPTTMPLGDGRTCERLEETAETKGKQKAESRRIVGKAGYLLFSEQLRRELKTQAAYANASLAELEAVACKRWDGFSGLERKTWVSRAKVQKNSSPETVVQAVPKQRNKVLLSDLFDMSDSELPAKRGAEGGEEAPSKH